MSSVNAYALATSLLMTYFYVTGFSALAGMPGRTLANIRAVAPTPI